MNSTIAAISTPHAVGGIAVVRLSGLDALIIADRVFRAVNGKKAADTSGNQALAGRIFDSAGEFDQAVCLVFRAPKSFTGENVAELSCHGGTYLSARLLRACLDNGAVMAEPGEFTRRALLNGKLNLTQAESVADMIHAQGEQGARAALACLDGKTYEQIRALCMRLVEIQSHLTAWTDFPEEDVPELEPSALTKELSETEKRLELLIAHYDRGTILQSGIQTVIAGRPNVGKSTLMNLLSGMEKSIVTDIAGTTRDIIEETVNLGKVTLRLSDTAGIRSANDAIEQEGVARTLDRIQKADLVLYLLDGSRKIEADDLEILTNLENKAAIAVINKSDLPCRADLSFIEQHFAHTVYISAMQNEGVDTLVKCIEEVLEIEQFDPAAAILANERQRSCAAQALKGVQSALSTLANGMTLDAVGIELDEAITALLTLTGESASDAVIDQVFERFCVGK